jgi:hypothetical protein
MVEVLLKFTNNGGAQADIGFAVKEATGVGEIVTGLIVLLEQPFASVTIIVTGKLAADPYV